MKERDQRKQETAERTAQLEQVAQRLKQATPEEHRPWRELGALQDDAHALEQIIASQLEYGYRDGMYTDGTRHHARIRPETRRVPVRAIHTGLTYRSERAAREYWGDLGAATLSRPCSVLEWTDGTLWTCDAPIVACLHIVAPDLMVPCFVIGRETRP